MKRVVADDLEIRSERWRRRNRLSARSRRKHDDRDNRYCCSQHCSHRQHAEDYPERSRNAVSGGVGRRALRGPGGSDGLHLAEREEGVRAGMMNRDRCRCQNR